MSSKQDLSDLQQVGKVRSSVQHSPHPGYILRKVCCGPVWLNSEGGDDDENPIKARHA